MGHHPKYGPFPFFSYQNRGRSGSFGGSSFGVSCHLRCPDFAVCLGHRLRPKTSPIKTEVTPVTRLQLSGPDQSCLPQPHAARHGPFPSHRSLVLVTVGHGVSPPNGTDGAEPVGNQPRAADVGWDHDAPNSPTGPSKPWGFEGPDPSI